jgi:hypothetical protein
MERGAWLRPMREAGVRSGGVISSAFCLTCEGFKVIIRATCEPWTAGFRNKRDQVGRSKNLSQKSLSHEMGIPKQGSRIVNAKGVPGTLGCVACALHTGRPVLLSTWHVLFGNGAAEDSPVFVDRSEHGSAGVAKSLYGKRGNVGYAGRSYYVDCAVASWPAPVASEGDGAAWPLGGGGVEMGSRVSKVGAASGVTQGVVVDTNYSDKILLNGKKYLAVGQLLVKGAEQGAAFAVEGDSGALVVDGCGRAVGLLWGTRVSGEAVVTPIAPVLFALNIAITYPA